MSIDQTIPQDPKQKPVTDVQKYIADELQKIRDDKAFAEILSDQREPVRIVTTQHIINAQNEANKLLSLSVDPRKPNTVSREHVDLMNSSIAEAIRSFADISNNGYDDFLNKRQPRASGINEVAGKIKKRLEKLQTEINKDSRFADIEHRYPANDYTERDNLPMFEVDKKSKDIQLEKVKHRVLRKPMQPEELLEHIDSTIRSTRISGIFAGSAGLKPPVHKATKEALDSVGNAAREMIKFPGVESDYPHGRIESEGAVEKFNNTLDTAINTIKINMPEDHPSRVRAKLVVLSNLQQLKLDIGFSNSTKITPSEVKTGPREPEKDTAPPPRDSKAPVGGRDEENPMQALLDASGFTAAKKLVVGQPGENKMPPVLSFAKKPTSGLDVA